MNNTTHTNARSTPAWCCLAVVFLLLFSIDVCAQLPNFTLSITATDETCPGNGSISFSVSGTDPAATVTYQVFQLPNTTTPIAFPTGNTINGLVAGDYQIVATQTLGALSNSQTWTETITDETIPLLYTIGGTNVSCGNNGTMTIEAFSGTPVSYEIIAGPMIRPLQTSPVFTGLAAGAYQVRVFDDCGQGWVITHTLFESTGNFLSWAETDDAVLVDCNQMTITNTLSPAIDETLSYPITITYTIFPPGGGSPIVQTTTLTSGSVSEQEFVTVIPYYSDLVYNYTVDVVDGCGNAYVFENILINKRLLVEMRSPPAECGEYMLTFALQHYMPPFTITFLQSPPGFDPVAYNPGHPGPFYDELINYGNSNNGVPYGLYEATITDSCGHSVTVQADLQYRDPEPQPTPEPHEGCDSNISDIMIKVSGYILNSAVIMSGPSAYSTSYPIDVGHLIDPSAGHLEIPNMNAGTYLIVMTDTCGNTYNYELIVVDPGSAMSWHRLPGCEPGHGTMQIRAGSGISLHTVRMIAAPSAYTVPLPHDVSYNISPLFPGIFSMASLPDGDYTFEIVDSCGYTRQMTVPVLGYEPVTDDTYTVIPHCGSFDLDVHFLASGPNSVTIASLWLQRYDPLTNTWGNPQTGVPYNPGDTPNDMNSYRLFQLNAINYNIAYLGDFRILHRFQVYENGSVDLYKLCVEEIFSFTVSNEIDITNIQKSTCDGINSNVTITAHGVPPLTYQITSKDSQPFFVNNGASNTFFNLQPAVYNFQVVDACGNITNELTDVALLPSLVFINQPDDLVLCDDDNNSQATFDLASQTDVVLGSASAADFTVTYHLSAQEAATNSNPLPASYTTGSRQIFVRMQYNTVATCYDTTSFDVIVNDYPELDMALSYGLCLGESTTITADAGFDSYLWSTGETTPSIVVDEAGTYTLDITQTTNGVTCSAQYTVTVVGSQPPAIKTIETTDWTNDQNTISVVLGGPTGDYSYSLDGINYQSGSVFYGLAPGLYTVYVKDNNGCGITTQEVHLLAYPKFFTPNNDGYNDFWQVYFAATEPHLKVYIFDRYGKLLTGFGSDSRGWDGRYNGQEMPSTDYWFLVVRENGKEHRGHFAMKR